MEEDNEAMERAMAIDTFNLPPNASARSVRVVRTTHTSAVKPAITPTLPLVSSEQEGEIELSFDKVIRKDNFTMLPPSTKQFIISIYGTYLKYLAATDPDKDPNRRLCELCLLHGNCFVNTVCAVNGLNILGISVTAPLPLKPCHLGGCSLMTEDPVQRFHLELSRICSSPEMIKYYREAL